MKIFYNRIICYLFLAYKDLIFRTFVLIFSAKTLGFCVATNLGFSSFMPTIGAIVGVLSLSLLLSNKRIKLLYIFLVDFTFTFILISQSLYFKYFKDFLSFYNIDQLHQLSAIQSSILDLISFEALFFIDLLFIPLFFFTGFHKNNLLSKEKLAAFFIVLSFGLYFNLNYLININFANSHISRYLFAYNFGILTYQADDIFSYLSDKLLNHAVSSTELHFVTDHLATHATPLTTHSYSGIGNGKNLILIQVESMQSFVLERKFKGKEITPNLNKLLKHGIVFRNIYDQTSAGSSSDALFLSNCSLYPAAKGTVAFRYAQNNYDSLAKLLAENGYTTMVLHAYYKSFWNFQQLDNALGFEHRLYEDSFTKDEVIGWGLSDHSFFNQSLDKIKSLPTPFYLLMRTLTTHDPFDSVTSAVDDFPVNDLTHKAIGRYIRSMHYVDAAIGDFVRGLSDIGLLSQTVLVIYGDHRARLPENELQQIGVQDREEAKKIPLIISNTDWKIPDANDTIGGLIDLAPTVSAIMGANTRGKAFLGKDLGRSDHGYVIFRDGSFISLGGVIDRESARKELMASDLIIEKNCIPQLRRLSQESE